MCSHMLLRTEVDLIAKQKKGNEFTCRFCRCTSWQKKWARAGGRVRPQIICCVLRDNKTKQIKSQWTRPRDKQKQIARDPFTRKQNRFATSAGCIFEARRTKTNRNGPDHATNKNKSHGTRPLENKIGLQRVPDVLSRLYEGHGAGRRCQDH